MQKQTRNLCLSFNDQFLTKIHCKIFALSFTLLMCGCTSIGKGITEAIMEKQNNEDTRICEITGDKFYGMKPQLEFPGRKMKVMMVHGVGNYVPGYSTQFLEKLAKALDLTVTVRNDKNISLTHPKDPAKQLGNLRINRFLNKEQNQELLFYELTWAEITAKEKDLLAYDNSGQQSFRRAEVNNLLKKFSNETNPDPLIYLGDKHEDILGAFTQSFCWMMSGDWDSLPDDVHQLCASKNVLPFDNNSYAFVSHSLGSRITIDGLQRIGEIQSNAQTAPNNIAETNRMKYQEITVYMMSNQLPMLQMGQNLPEISKQHDTYCRSNGAKYADRMLAKTSIVAFSDPNDLLSYSIPYDFINKYLDSRLCSNVTNININVAKVYDAFGLGKLANPMDAHMGYETDDRVIALIAKGVANERTAPIINDRCRWIETID